jgi:hypothetical protein
MEAYYLGENLSKVGNTNKSNPSKMIIQDVDMPSKTTYTAYTNVTGLLKLPYNYQMAAQDKYKVINIYIKLHSIIGYGLLVPKSILY